MICRRGYVKSVDLSKICRVQSIANTVETRNRILNLERPLNIDPAKNLAVWTSKNFSTVKPADDFCWKFRGDPNSNLDELRQFKSPETTLQPRHELPSKDNGLVSRTRNKTPFRT